MNLYDKDLEINHVTIFINIEEFSLTNTKQIKFAVPSIFPGSGTDQIIETSVTTVNSNIINKDQIQNETFTLGNFVTCDLPHHIARECHHDKNKIVPKGIKFIGCFVNGEILDPKILQKYDYQ